MWNLKNNTNECICKTETDSQIQKTSQGLSKRVGQISGKELTDANDGI